MHKGTLKQICTDESSKQTIKSVSTHYIQAIRLKQGLDFKVNWNGVNGALNLNIES